MISGGGKGKGVQKVDAVRRKRVGKRDRVESRIVGGCF